MVQLRSVIATVAVLVAAATGSAATSGDAIGAGTKGYSAGAISGVTAESVTYETTGVNITAVRLVLTGDTRRVTIKLAFNDSAPAQCSAAGVYLPSADHTAYLCVVTSAVADATTFVLIAG